MAVDIGQVIINGWTVGIQREGLLQLLLRAFFILGISQKTGKGHAGARVSRMSLDEILISLSHRFQSLLNFPFQLSRRYCGTFSRKLVIVTYPLVYLALSPIIFVH